MLETSERLMAAGYQRHLFSDNDLQCLLDGTASSRHSRVNKALARGELVRLRRGLYTLAKPYLQIKWMRLYLANRIGGHSFVSMESALAYHGWIPERVNITTSATAKRAQQFENLYGVFVYYPVPHHRFEWLSGVESVELDGQRFLVARPLRALFDYVYVRKVSWQGLDFLTESLRIDESLLRAIDVAELSLLAKVYRSKRVVYFIEKLTEALS